jgi:hypothetical protein
MITRKFESRFKQCDEPPVNGGGARSRRNFSLSIERPAGSGFSAFLESVLTLAVEGGVTMRRGPPLPGAVGPSVCRADVHAFGRTGHAIINVSIRGTDF